jgi:hypothetical protein
VQGETRKRWEQLCSLAETEQDPDKFLTLHREIVALLESKEVRLQHKPQKEPSINTARMTRVKGLAAQIAVEQNPNKFAKLITELNEALQGTDEPVTEPTEN